MDEKSCSFLSVFTAVLQLVPDRKYERYVRSFMGLLLIYMLCTPVFAVFGKAGSFWKALQIPFIRNRKGWTGWKQKSFRLFI